jgi:transcriptional regulator with PAS, ATPase and Fis domain
VDVRIIAASNQDLSRQVADNRFRIDLYFRINVLSINVPPLRERKEDIFALLEAFIKRSRFADHTSFSLFEQVRKELEDYSWPGNIRELENFVERFLVLSEEASDPAAILQSQIRGLYSMGNEYLGIADEPVSSDKTTLSIKVGTLEDMEKEILEKMQQLYPSEKKASLAQQLNISRTTLWKKLKTLEEAEACNS